MSLLVPGAAAAATPRSQSRAGTTSAITRPIASRNVALVWSIAPMAFHVSNISRP